MLWSWFLAIWLLLDRYSARLQIFSTYICERKVEVINLFSLDRVNSWNFWHKLRTDTSVVWESVVREWGLEGERKRKKCRGNGVKEEDWLKNHGRIGNNRNVAATQKESIVLCMLAKGELVELLTSFEILRFTNVNNYSFAAHRVLKRKTYKNRNILVGEIRFSVCPRNALMIDHTRIRRQYTLALVEALINNLLNAHKPLWRLQRYLSEVSIHELYRAEKNIILTTVNNLEN